MAMSPALPRSSAPPRWQDYVQLLKPRVMSLVIFTAITGLVCANAPINPVLGAVAIFCIAVGAGASAAFNMWYDADIDAKMRRTRARPVPAGKVQGADALAICTEWKQFIHPDLAEMRRVMRQPVVFDGRNIYNPARMQAAGFTYYSIGRPAVKG